MLRHLKTPAVLAALLMSMAAAPQTRAAEPALPDESTMLSLPVVGLESDNECRPRRRTRYFRVNGRRVRARYSHTGYKRINGRRYKVRYYRRY